MTHASASTRSLFVMVAAVPSGGRSGTRALSGWPRSTAECLRGHLLRRSDRVRLEPDCAAGAQHERREHVALRAGGGYGTNANSLAAVDHVDAHVQPVAVRHAEAPLGLKEEARPEKRARNPRTTGRAIPRSVRLVATDARDGSRASALVSQLAGKIETGCGRSRLGHPVAGASLTRPSRPRATVSVRYSLPPCRFPNSRICVM